MPYQVSYKKKNESGWRICDTVKDVLKTLFDKVVKEGYWRVRVRRA